MQFSFTSCRLKALPWLGNEPSSRHIGCATALEKLWVLHFFFSFCSSTTSFMHFSNGKQTLFSYTTQSMQRRPQNDLRMFLITSSKANLCIDIQWRPFVWLCKFYSILLTKWIRWHFYPESCPWYLWLCWGTLSNTLPVGLFLLNGCKYDQCGVS